MTVAVIWMSDRSAVEGRKIWFVWFNVKNKPNKLLLILLRILTTEY